MFASSASPIGEVKTFFVLLLRLAARFLTVFSAART